MSIPWSNEDNKLFDELVSSNTSISKMADELNRSDFAVVCKLIKSKDFEPESLMGAYSLTEEMFKWGDENKLLFNREKIMKTLNLRENTVKKLKSEEKFFVIDTPYNLRDKFKATFSEKKEKGYYVMPYTNLNFKKLFYEKFEIQETYDMNILDEVIEFVFTNRK